MHSVIVTGASRGLGLGIARKLASAGYQVVAIARSRSEHLSADGPIHFVPFDLSKIEEIPQLVKKIRKEFGPIFGLVNNAGISFEGVLAMMPVSQIEQLVRL